MKNQVPETARFSPPPCWIIAGIGGLLTVFPALTQTILTEGDPKENPGQRPYEMVWAGRIEPAPPTVSFDRLTGWEMQVQGGAKATLQVSRTQNLWDRPVARLRYSGDGQAESHPRVLLRLPEPVLLPAGADAVDLWLYGNRWDWVNPPGTPAVEVVLHLSDAAGTEQAVRVGRVRWEEWWLMHSRLASTAKPPVRLEQIEVSGGWQTEPREIFLDSVRFYHEELGSIPIAPRPRRNLRQFDGQSAGANTGPGRLSFPTREATILPPSPSSPVRTGLTQDGSTFLFEARRGATTLVYVFDPARGLSGLSVVFNHQPAGRPLDGATIRRRDGLTNAALIRVARQQDVLMAEYADETTLRLRLWQQSLVVDVINRTGEATELNLGQITGVTAPRTVWVPYLTYGGGAHPCVLLSQAGGEGLFSSIWVDWYRSNGSELFAAESAATNTARINGGVRYLPRTDGQRNPLFERLFLTVSPRFEEVLPTIPNPVGLHAREAVDRLWQESWGPDDYAKQMKRSRMLRAYGIEKLIQCNHEIAWRDGGESFTLRLRAAPKKGGDAALQGYVAHQQSLDWLSGLYSNYTDYAPVNEFWTPDGVQRNSDGNWRSAWPRCYALKPLKAVELDARLAPLIKAKYKSNSAYTDVHTAVAPWGYNDYDARVPGAATFAQTFYAYGELLRNDSRVYQSPIFSEGTYQWLYAGLADGNYALAYDGRPLAQAPLLPVFDLLQIHPRECDIGMGWTAHFCDAIKDWRASTNIDHAIDRFLLHTLAYGHIGWLVEEEHGIARTCRSYYMLQQVQARYGLKTPERIAYWDGARLCDVSEAIVRDLPRTRRQLHVEYPGGAQLWLNDHPAENWTVPLGSPNRRRFTLGPSEPLPSELTLPPGGWAAFQPEGDLFSFSALDGTNRVDYLRSAAYTYLDGRGAWFLTSEAGSNGGLVVRPSKGNRLEIIRISGQGAFVVRRPYGVRGGVATAEAFDADGQPVAPPKIEDESTETRVTPVEGAIRYVLTFRRS